MLYPIIRKASPDFAESALDLLQSTARTLILITGGFFLFWMAPTLALKSQEVVIPLLPFIFLFLSAAAAGLILLPRSYLAAMVFWQVGLFLAIPLGLWVMKAPAFLLFYAFLPLIAVVTLGWPAALLSGCLAVGSIFWIVHTSGFVVLPGEYIQIAIVGGALAGCLGWASTNSFLAIAQWSIYSYDQAHKKIEEARDQQVELKQVQEDLVQANRELVRLSDRLKAMNQVAEEARKVKEEFVANVSHELRTPLNMIIGFCEMITQAPQVYGEKLPPMLLSDITAIQRNSRHLSALIDDVLDLSQIEAGRMALTKQWVDLQDIFHEAVEAVSTLFDSKQLYIHVELPPERVRLFCDSTRIREVILNLLSNAGRFTTHGGVMLRARLEDDQVVISLADTGPGISREEQARLFEPFYQIDSSIRRKVGGSGLGLSISKQFVEMHDGKMWLESEVGVGTTFFFSLPIQSAFADGTPGYASARRWINPFQTYEGRTRLSKAPLAVLKERFVIMESGGVLEHYIQRYMEGVEVVSTRTLPEAIEAVRESPAQALILNTPPDDRSHEENPSDLGNLPFDTPIVTCWVPGSGDTARQLGVVRYLLKPVTRSALLSALSDLGNEIITVLLVEDIPEALQLFTRILASGESQYRVIRAMNGQQALDMMRERHPDAVLLDLVLPGKDGFQVLTEKGQDVEIRDIPVIIISSLDPVGTPIISSSIEITRKGGLSIKDLLGSIQAVSEILAAPGRTKDRGSPAAARV